ncbi:MAG: hypothetical protein ACI4N1_01955 [Stenotrophomonas koreensis]
MKRITWPCWLALTLLLASSLQATAAPRAERALWTWEAESYAMVDDPAVAEEAISYLKSRGFDRLYLYADAYRGRHLLRDQPERYHALIQRLRANGISAYALLGSWYLNTETYVLPERRADALAMLQHVLDYNAAAPAAARFDGANLDIEPHILDAWNEHTRLGLLRHFLDMSKALMDAKQASGQTLLLGPAIPFWLDGYSLDWNGRQALVSEHMIDTWDYVALMDYRDFAEGRDSILSHAASELDYARRAGKPVVIGLEVSPNDINKVTFAEEGPAVFEREVAKVEAALQGHPAFAGFAIHHYRAWRAWEQRHAE